VLEELPVSTQEAEILVTLHDVADHCLMVYYRVLDLPCLVPHKTAMGQHALICFTPSM
jgi:hypothetical protein